MSIFDIFLTRCHAPILILFHFQNVEKGKTYSVTLYVRSSGAINVSVSLTSSNGLQTLAAENIM